MTTEEYELIIAEQNKEIAASAIEAAHWKAKADQFSKACHVKSKDAHDLRARVDGNERLLSYLCDRILELYQVEPPEEDLDFHETPYSD